MNKAILAGYLGKDPETRSTTGKTVTAFSIATGTKDNTEWHHVEAWEKTAELIGKYLKKGSYAIIEGRIKTEKYEKDGQERRITKIIADRVHFGPNNNSDLPF